MGLKVRYRGDDTTYRVSTTPERAARLLVNAVPRQGDAHVEVLDEERGVMWVFTPQELREEDPSLADKWGWWTPHDRPAYVFYDIMGRVVEVGPTLSRDEVICDFCNVLVEGRPVPLIGNMAVCPSCFERITGIPLTEAAQRDGIELSVLQEGGLIPA